MLRYSFTICFLFIIKLLADYDNITLSQLLKKTALLNNINIVYSDFNDSNRYTLTINNFITAKDLLGVTKALLDKEGYNLLKLNKSFYIVSKKEDKRHTYLYRVKNSNSSILLNKIGFLYPHNIFKLNNRYLLIKYSNKPLLKEILANLKAIDYTPSAYYISLNIYNVDTNALKRIGINLNNTNNIEQGLIIQRHIRFVPAILNLLKDNKKSKLVASPKLFLAPDINNIAEFKEVTTIPIQVKKTQIIQGTNPIVTNTNETIYKDIGLKLSLRYINTTADKKVKFSLELTDSNIISYSDVGITSSAREIKAIIQAKLNTTIFIAGLSKTITTKRLVGIPVLKEIPIIKYLFSKKESKEEKRTLVITLTIRKAKNGK